MLIPFITASREAFRDAQLNCLMIGHQRMRNSFEGKVLREIAQQEFK